MAKNIPEDHLPTHINCRCILPSGTKAFFNGVLLGETINKVNMTDDEKIDYYETERIFKLYGINPHQREKI